MGDEHTHKQQQEKCLHIRCEIGRSVFSHIISSPLFVSELSIFASAASVTIRRRSLLFFPFKIVKACCICSYALQIYVCVFFFFGCCGEFAGVYVCACDLLFFFCQLCCLQWLHFVCQSATALREQQTHVQKKKNRKSKSTDLKKDSKKEIE